MLSRFSRVPLCATLWIAARQVLCPWEEYWSGLPFPSPEDLSDPGIKPGSPTLQADSLTSEPPGKPISYTVQLQYTAPELPDLWCLA